MVTGLMCVLPALLPDTWTAQSYGASATPGVGRDAIWLNPLFPPMDADWNILPASLPRTPLFDI
jgi:hypothetical protein